MVQFSPLSQSGQTPVNALLGLELLNRSRTQATDPVSAAGNIANSLASALLLQGAQGDAKQEAIDRALALADNLAPTGKTGVPLGETPDDARIAGMLRGPAGAALAPIVEEEMLAKMLAGPGDPFKLGAGETMFGPEGEVIAEGAPETDFTNVPGVGLVRTRGGEAEVAIAAPKEERAARTDIGKARQDFRDGLISAEEFEGLRLGGADPQKQFQNADKLRDEFRASSKDFVTARDAFARVQTSAQNPSPAGDLALIFNFMKVLDPGSVVRESEFANAAATGSFGDEIQARVQRILSGERLTESQRQDFTDRAQGLYTKQVELQQGLIGQYENLATRFGLDPQNIIVDFQAGMAEAEAQQEVGGAIQNAPDKSIPEMDLETLPQVTPDNVDQIEQRLNDLEGRKPEQESNAGGVLQELFGVSPAGAAVPEQSPGRAFEDPQFAKDALARATPEELKILASSEGLMNHPTIGPVLRRLIGG